MNRTLESVSAEQLDRAVTALRGTPEAGEVLTALVAAMAFIDSHVADPDLTNEMVEKYAALQALSPREVIARAMQDLRGTLNGEEVQCFTGAATMPTNPSDCSIGEGSGSLRTGMSEYMRRTSPTIGEAMRHEDREREEAIERHERQLAYDRMVTGTSFERLSVDGKRVRIAPEQVLRPTRISGHDLGCFASDFGDDRRETNFGFNTTIASGKFHRSRGLVDFTKLTDRLDADRHLRDALAEHTTRHNRSNTMDKPTIALIPWQRRLVEEREELRQRAERLDAFLKEGSATPLGEPHTSLLYQQFVTMKLLGDILDKRIALFVEVDPFNPPEEPQTPAA